jgi:hypothetical protein
LKAGGVDEGTTMDDLEGVGDAYSITFTCIAPSHLLPFGSEIEMKC